MKSKVNSSFEANVDEIVEESSYQKGAKFEKEFAEFMRTNLGYYEAVTKMDVRSAAKATGTEVDVIGYRKDPRGARLRMLGIIYISLASIGIILKAFVTYNENNTLNAETSNAIFIFSLFVICAGFFSIYKGKNLHLENGWVECKNRKIKSNQDEIDTMLAKFKHYKNSSGKKLNFTELYFVSANGFVDNVLEYAKNQNIRCFVKDSNGEFLEV